MGRRLVQQPAIIVGKAQTTVKIMKTYELYQMNEDLNEKIYSRIISAIKSEDEVADAYKALSDEEKFVLLSFAADIVGDDYEGDLEAFTLSSIIDVYQMKK